MDDMCVKPGKTEEKQGSPRKRCQSPSSNRERGSPVTVVYRKGDGIVCKDLSRSWGQSRKGEKKMDGFSKKRLPIQYGQYVR